MSRISPLLDEDIHTMYGNPAVFQLVGRNMVGRDFVFGDIHGAFDMVVKCMQKVGFDTSSDRIFCVGDLIDRGQGSNHVLEFLAKPYVYAVMGNHEHTFSTLSLKEIRSCGHFNLNGMNWVCSVSDERLLAIKRRLAQLPIAMQVQNTQGAVGLVHGDVPARMDWASFIDALQCGDTCSIDIALNGRDRIERRNVSGVRGIDRVFVGHSVQWYGPRRFGNVYAIDTGAGYRNIVGCQGYLTMVDLDEIVPSEVHIGCTNSPRWCVRELGTAA